MPLEKFKNYHWSRWVLLGTIVFAILYTGFNLVASSQQKATPQVPSSTPVPTAEPTASSQTTPVPTCGGISGEVYPTGYACKMDGDYPDAMGMCIPQKGTKTTPAPTQSDGEMTVCTMEAKECPDGSFVGREGPNCEFAACPAPR